MNSNNILFLMIPGFNGTKRSWGKIVSQLSKLGEVYSYTPIFYTKYKKGLTENDLILRNHCEQLFENIHLKKNQKIIICQKIQKICYIINYVGSSFHGSCWERKTF